MANIKLDVTNPINGQFVTFTAPCSCDVVTDGLIIDDVIYTIVDAMGNTMTGLGGVWCEGAKVSVILDVANRKAYIQNGSYAKCTTPLTFGIDENGVYVITED